MSTDAPGVRATDADLLRHARSAYEDAYKADTADPSQAESFAIFLRGFRAAHGVPVVQAPSIPALMEAAHEASKQGFLTGTTNWAFAMQRALAAGVGEVGRG